MKRLLITGSSGLLGRALRLHLIEKGYKVIGTCLSRAGKHPDTICVDLTNFTKVEELIGPLELDYIIHSAAQRAPEQVEKNLDASIQLNVSATKHLAEIAARKKIPLIFISTDYVFDGSNAPYKDTDKPNPTNKYGESKLEGEKVVMEANSENIILRIPVLYGAVETLAESAITCLLETLLDKNEKKVSDYEIRWPAHVNDIAEICYQLVEKKDPSVCGVFQWSGKEGLTKYQMVHIMAEQFGLDARHVIAEKESSSTVARPYNCQMDSSKLENLSIGQHTPFTKGIFQCLQRFV